MSKQFAIDPRLDIVIERFIDAPVRLVGPRYQRVVALAARRVAP